MKKKFVIIACALLLCCVTGKADLTVTVSIHSRLQVQGFSPIFDYFLALIIPQNRCYVLALQRFLIVQWTLIWNFVEYKKRTASAVLFYVSSLIYSSSADCSASIRMSRAAS